MAYSSMCADAGMDCPGSFTTETKELIKRVELHANEAHPEVDVQSEQVEVLVKSSDQGARGNERATTLPPCELNPPLGRRFMPGHESRPSARERVQEAAEVS